MGGHGSGFQNIMSDFGSTFDAPGDLTPSMRLLSTDLEKERGLLQSWARRLNMDLGSLWYDPNAGLSMRDFVADDEDPSVAATQINQELLKDERCAKCTTNIDVVPGGWLVTVKPSVDSGATYSLVFKVTADKSSLLTATPGS
jgi:hypothetical protein